ncbi:MAG: RNA 2',3'-cyclic phosphodiesterase [Planctomycetes bacterium]|nr:RNA 2',3'-cyclic phosphodiesterase [Planctomycetota bacterium]
MRCFIAIDINDRIRTEIKRLMRDLRRATALDRPDVKWADPDLIHLTLKFLGEIRDREVVDVCRVLSEVVSGHKGFSIEIERVGSFGQTVRVVWVGVRENDALESLQSELDTRLFEIGFAGDRKGFKGHLTLCRVKNAAAGVKMGKHLGDCSDVSLGPLAVDSVCIYKSELTSTGPIYTVVSRVSLQ